MQDGIPIETDLSPIEWLQARNETFMRAMYELPENPPAIDFSVYRQRLTNTKMVEEFEQKYKAVKVSVEVVLVGRSTFLRGSATVHSAVLGSAAH